MNKFLKTHLKYIVDPKDNMIFVDTILFRDYAKIIFAGYHNYGELRYFHYSGNSHTVYKNIVILYNKDGKMIGLYYFYKTHFTTFIFNKWLNYGSVNTLWNENYTYYE